MYEAKLRNVTFSSFYTVDDKSFSWDINLGLRWRKVRTKYAQIFELRLISNVRWSFWSESDTDTQMESVGWRVWKRILVGDMDIVIRGDVTASWKLKHSIKMYDSSTLIPLAVNISDLLRWHYTFNLCASYGNVQPENLSYGKTYRRRFAERLT